MMVTDDGRADLLLLRCEGRLDSSVCAVFEKELIGRIGDASKPVVIDLGAVDYISSAGLRVLLMAAKKVRAAKGRIALCRLKDHIREVFEISGFLSIFAVYPTVEAATG